jgi:hypothetical protein
MSQHGWISEAKYRAFDRERDEELTTVGDRLRELISEQQRLFAEIERASESISPSEIFGASMPVMNLSERVMSQGGPPIRLAEPEVVAAGMAKFIDRLYEADDEALSKIEMLSANLCSRRQSEAGLRGAKVTRVVVLGRVLNYRLARMAPLCAREAQWLATTLLSNLDKLAAMELGERPS